MTCDSGYYNLFKRRVFTRNGKKMTIDINEKTRDFEFKNRIKEISGQNFHGCMQCGTCSGSCPMVEDMDVFPRKMMQLLQLGLKKRVLDSKTSWICASCHTCQVRCPRSIELPRIMEAIRQVQLRENRDYLEISKIPGGAVAGLPQIAMVGCFRKHTS